MNTGRERGSQLQARASKSTSMPTQIASALRSGALRHHRRHFLGKLLEQQQTGKSRQQRWQRVVQYPPRTIYRAVAGVDQYSSFLPWCTSSRVTSTSLDNDGAGELDAEITVGFRSLSASFASRVHLLPLERIHAVSEPNEYIDHLEFTWEFGAIGASACRLDLTLDFSLRSPEHILMWELAHDKIISEYVRCFSKRCVALEAEDAAAESAASSGGAGA